MSKERNVIAHKNLPRKVPVYQTITVWLLLSYTNAPSWLWGAIGLLFLLIWIITLIDIAKYRNVEVDLFDDRERHR